MFGTCSKDGCASKSTTLSNLCRFHSALMEARELSHDQFDQLRDALAKTAPVTDDERRQRRGRYALRDIEWKSRDLRRAKRDARSAGVTEGQIADAVKRGKDQVK